MEEVIERVFGSGPDQHVKIDRFECLVDALAEEERSLVSLFREIARLAKKPNRVTLDEYFAYRIYRRSLRPGDRETYLGKQGAEELHDRTIDREYVAGARDKVVFDQIMRAEGFPVPPIRALYHPYRRLEGVRTLRTPSEVSEYLLSTRDIPLFSKPVRERQSLGAELWEDTDEGQRALITANGRTVSVDDLTEAIRIFDRFGYLFQERIVPHAELRQLSGATTSTVRITVLLDDRSPHILRAAWKIPREGAVADNLWRQGNMLGALDTDSGEVTRVVRGQGAGQETVTTHPDTGKELVGFRYPGWDEICTACKEAARVFPGIGFQAWDVVAGDDGPVFVELNFGGDPMLMQLAHQKGMYDRELRELIERAPNPAEHQPWWT